MQKKETSLIKSLQRCMGIFSEKLGRILLKKHEATEEEILQYKEAIIQRQRSLPNLDEFNREIANTYLNSH